MMTRHIRLNIMGDMPQSRSTLEGCHSSIQSLFEKQMMARGAANSKLCSYAVYPTVRKTYMNLIAEKGVRSQGVLDPQVRVQIINKRAI